MSIFKIQAQILGMEPRFKNIDLNPFGGNFNFDVTEQDKKNITNIGVGGAILGPAGTILAASGSFDFTDPLGTHAAMKQQQDLMNQYQAQQDQLIRDEQNRRWQAEISSSWAAYGAQRRSMVASSGGGGGSALGTQTATDIYLGGR